MKPLVDVLAKYHEEFTDFIDKDANSFNGVIDAFKLPKSTDEEKAAMTAEALNVSKLVESEGVVENLIKAQWFKVCVVYLDGTSANIVVKTDGLVPSEAAQIKDILLSKVSVPQENIAIFEVK